jgi:glyoxylase-like metal-dependent hydrolase (beta-lactamase superfamily II)
MGISIKNFILGPIENNTYLLYDQVSHAAVLIDPAIPSRKLLEFIHANGLQLAQIWITHAHFDHIGGVRALLAELDSAVPVKIHPDAVPLWNSGGGAADFGFEFDPGPAPHDTITEGEMLSVGSITFTVLHTPGHTPGDVTYYCESERAAFCGDLIFYHGVGRTDLAGSNESDLIASITSKIFNLPDATILYPGHGRSTTVAEEKQNNPFI